MAVRHVTIADVAAAAGVSVATVSKVINDRYGVAENTSARVRTVIHDLGYTSSLVAQSLRSRRSHVIGVLVADIEPFNAELLKGAARAMRGTGYDLARLLGLRSARGSGRLGAALAQPDQRSHRRSDPRHAEQRRRKPLGARRRGRPQCRGRSLAHVDADNLSGAVMATEHLIALGHRRIGFLCRARRPRVGAAPRAGYRHALQRAGDRVRSRPRSGRRLPTRTPHGPPRTSCSRCRAADGDLRRERRLGDRDDRRRAVARACPCPHDLSVVGFDDVPESALSEPPMTTIDQPIQRMGTRRCSFSSGSSSSSARRRAPAQVVLPTRLVERRSSAAPREPA